MIVDWNEFIEIKAKVQDNKDPFHRKIIIINTWFANLKIYCQSVPVSSQQKNIPFNEHEI